MDNKISVPRWYLKSIKSNADSRLPPSNLSEYDQEYATIDINVLEKEEILNQLLDSKPLKLKNSPIPNWRDLKIFLEKFIQSKIYIKLIEYIYNFKGDCTNKDCAKFYKDEIEPNFNTDDIRKVRTNINNRLKKYHLIISTDKKTPAIWKIEATDGYTLLNIVPQDI